MYEICIESGGYRSFSESIGRAKTIVNARKKACQYMVVRDMPVKGVICTVYKTLSDGDMDIVGSVILNKRGMYIWYTDKGRYVLNTDGTLGEKIR